MPTGIVLPSDPTGIVLPSDPSGGGAAPIGSALYSDPTVTSVTDYLIDPATLTGSTGDVSAFDRVFSTGGYVLGITGPGWFQVSASVEIDLSTGESASLRILVPTSLGQLSITTPVGSDGFAVHGLASPMFYLDAGDVVPVEVTNPDRAELSNGVIYAVQLTAG